VIYKYLYQDKKNNNCEGEIKARNRDEAYRLIRKQGIRPYRVIGDDPWNWRPWAVALGYLVLLAVIGYLAMKQAEKPTRLVPIDKQGRTTGTMHSVTEATAAQAELFRSKAIEAVNNAPEAYRYNVWKGVNVRLEERGLEPLPRPEGLDKDSFDTPLTVTP